jgi:hypothetical protein
MNEVEPGVPNPGDQYRESARAMRALIPTMRDPEAKEQLGLIALQYERLAEGLDRTSEWLRVTASPPSS